MGRWLTAGLLSMTVSAAVHAQSMPEWKLETATRCRMTTQLGSARDRVTIVFQTDFKAPGELKVAVLGDAVAGESFSLESPAGSWVAKRDSPTTSAAARRFEADVAAGAEWTLRRAAKQGVVELRQGAGNAVQAAAAFDACVAAIPKRRPIAASDAIRPAELQVELRPTVCVLDAWFAHGEDRVNLKLVDVPDAPQMIVTGLVRTQDELVGIVDLSTLGGEKIELRDLAARNDVADTALLRARLLAGEMLKVPVSFTTGDTWTLALGGGDQLTTIAAFDACVRVRGRQ